MEDAIFARDRYHDLALKIAKDIFQPIFELFLVDVGVYLLCGLSVDLRSDISICDQEVRAFELLIIEG